MKHLNNQGKLSRKWILLGAIFLFFVIWSIMYMALGKSDTPDKEVATKDSIDSTLQEEGEEFADDLGKINNAQDTVDTDASKENASQINPETQDNVNQTAQEQEAGLKTSKVIKASLSPHWMSMLVFVANFCLDQKNVVSTLGVCIIGVMIVAMYHYMNYFSLWNMHALLIIGASGIFVGFLLPLAINVDNNPLLFSYLCCLFWFYIGFMQSLYKNDHVNKVFLKDFCYNLFNLAYLGNVGILLYSLYEKKKKNTYTIICTCITAILMSLIHILHNIASGDVSTKKETNEFVKLLEKISAYDWLPWLAPCIGMLFLKRSTKEIIYVLLCSLIVYAASKQAKITWETGFFPKVTAYYNLQDMAFDTFVGIVAYILTYILKNKINEISFKEDIFFHIVLQIVLGWVINLYQPVVLKKYPMYQYDVLVGKMGRALAIPCVYGILYSSAYGVLCGVICIVIRYCPSLLQIMYTASLRNMRSVLGIPFEKFSGDIPFVLVTSLLSMLNLKNFTVNSIGTGISMCLIALLSTTRCLDGGVIARRLPVGALLLVSYLIQDKDKKSHLSHQKTIGVLAICLLVFWLLQHMDFFAKMSENKKVICWISMCSYTVILLANSLFSETVFIGNVYMHNVALLFVVGICLSLTIISLLKSILQLFDYNTEKYSIDYIFAIFIPICFALMIEKKFLIDKKSDATCVSKILGSSCWMIMCIVYSLILMKEKSQIKEFAVPILNALYVVCYGIEIHYIHKSSENNACRWLFVASLYCVGTWLLTYAMQPSSSNNSPTAVLVAPKQSEKYPISSYSCMWFVGLPAVLMSIWYSSTHEHMVYMLYNPFF